MKLFTENSTLVSMNEALVTQIPNYSLIGDLPLSIKDFNHLASIIVVLHENSMNPKIFFKYKECITVFLVFCAVYEYESGTFWKSVEKYMGELTSHQRTVLSTIFLQIVEKYNLNKFEHESEEGYAYVTPILCHAGIPINSFEDYFVAISNTVNDVFYDDFDVDDYITYLKNKTEMTVKRYIKLSDKRDSYNFIQSTRILMLNDSVDSDEEMETGNYIRMYEQITNWKEKPKNKKTIQARVNVQITAPKIKIDLDGVGVYCELPRIVVKECYDSYLIWEISSDETSNVVKADFFRRSGVLVSEEKILTLKAAQSYIITLKVDDNLISKWEIAGLKNNYIAFSQNGTVIKTENLPNSPVILLLNKSISLIKKDELSLMELPQIPLWTDFNVYQVDLSKMKVLECTGMSILINSENKPIMVGGETLFNQENCKAYFALPYIKVPILNEGEWHIEIKHKIRNDVISKSNEVVSSNYEFILLSSYINKECYGDYDLKIWNRTGINGRYSFEYVPFGKVQVDENDYWPSLYQGYVNSIQSLRTSIGVELELYNAEKVSEIHHDNHILHKYKVNEKDRFLIGDYRYTYNDHAYSTPIKKSIYPISWGIIGLENEIIELTSRVYTLTLEDLSTATDPYLLFAFDFDSDYDIQYLTIELVGQDQQVVKKSNSSINNKGRLRIPLNPYLFEIQSTSNEIDYQLRVDLLDTNETLVSSFLVARFQEEVVVTNVQHTQNEKEIFISWEEMGTCTGREIVLVNFLKPWIRPYHYQIEDKTCEVTINLEEFEEGIYKYLIQKEADDLFFEGSEAEICTLIDFQKRRFVVKGEQNFTSNLEKILYFILRSRFMKKDLVPKKLKQIETEISSVSINVPADIHLIANAYILYDTFFSEDEDTSTVMKLFTLLFDLFSSNQHETLKYILESDFSKEYKKELLHKFHCNNLTSNIKLNEFQYKMLADIDEDMSGFINLIQSGNSSKGLNWAGISGLDVLKEEDLFGDGNGTFLTDENLGNSSYIVDYFEYVYECIQKPKNLTKTSADFLREFQRDYKIDETMLFGKTRLQLLVEWKERNKNTQQIQERLAYVLDFECDKETKKKFKEAFHAISKRKTKDEVGYYIGLIALYASLIRNGVIKERKEFGHLLHYTIEKCEKLYYRDALIIELYMHLERGFSWV